MTAPLDIFIGYDERDDRAFRVAEASLHQSSSIRLNIHAIKESEMRRYGYARTYRVEPNGQMLDTTGGLETPFSTKFSFTRFLVPYLAGYRNCFCVFMDPDVLARGDIAELIEFCKRDEPRAAWCVQQTHVPNETVKMDGVQQTKYERKNWSSVVVWNPARNDFLTVERVNILKGNYLHGFGWLEDRELGALPIEWNFLVGWTNSCARPKIVHFTQGTPDFAGYESQPYADEWRAVWRSCVRGASALDRYWWDGDTQSARGAHEAAA